MATPADIAASLTMDDIPVKLRCAACNKLANNAFRIPCCDQSICDECQASLPEACPVCLHEPVKADDCRPNKALRTTIKVFLKKKIIERETAEKKRIAAEKGAAAPATPAAPLQEETHAQQPSQTLVSASVDGGTAVKDVQQSSRQASQAPQEPNGETTANGQTIPTEAQKDIPQQSIESPGPGIQEREATQASGEGGENQEKGVDTDKNDEQQQAMAQMQWAMNNGLPQGSNNGAFGFDGTNNTFPNMGMAGMGDMSQMMQMMPNGMPNNMMGSFPNVMGMSGMGMDPMAFNAAMYGGYGGQGMGMNGMNMGMGFDAGQGAFGGFNGQSAAWNAGQAKFNQNSYGAQAGMGGGDFGANSGYGGYNMPPHQGNFNQVHPHQYPNNDFQHGHHGQGFQNRGRGRGRGYFNTGRGRGGYHQYNQYNQAQGNQANQESFQQPSQPEVTRRGSPVYGPTQDRPDQESNADDPKSANADSNTNDVSAEEQLNKELAPGDAEDAVETTEVQPPKELEATVDPAATQPPEIEPPVRSDVDAVQEKEKEKPAPIETFISDEPAKPEASAPESLPTTSAAMLPPPSPIAPTGPAALRAGDHTHDISTRGRGSSRGYHRGLDARGGSYGRGAGYLPNGNANHIQSVPPLAKPSVVPVAPRGTGVEGAPTGPKALREGQPNTGVKGFSIVGRASAAAQARPGAASSVKSPPRERSRSRSPTRHQSSHHRHHRHRSTSLSSSADREKRRERHHRHSRRHRDESDADEQHESKPSRKRDASVESTSKRSSHRSRREHEKDHKDTERSAHRSHRSHRDKSRDRDRSREGNTREQEKFTHEKKEPSPELVINGASRAKRAQEKVQAEANRSSRKRRSDDDEEHDRHRDRDQKRRRRGQEEDINGEEENKHNGHRATKLGRHDLTDSAKTHTPSNHNRETPTQRPKSPPKGPKIDSHLSEREKYAAERIARENQRRLSQMGTAGKGGGGRIMVKGAGGRRVSMKYEDDDVLSRGEMEREALRNR